MPSYRNGNDEYRRRPKMDYEEEYELEPDGVEEDAAADGWKPFKKPSQCKVVCPFKIEVRLVPCFDHNKRPLA